MLNLEDGLSVEQIREKLDSYRHQNGLPDRFAKDVIDSLVRFVRSGYVVYHQQGENTSSLSRCETRAQAEEILNQDTSIGQVLIHVNEAELAYYVRVQTYLAAARADTFSQMAHAKVVELCTRVEALEKAARKG